MITAWFAIDYHQWWLVLFYVLLVGVFVYGVLQPRRKSEWRSAGVAQAWVIALYAEMYGTPLTAYLLMNWLGRSEADAETHFNGHAWPLLFGFSDSMTVWLQFATTVLGQALIVAGALVALVGWRQVYLAVRQNRMATEGLYRYFRHPQYTGFFLFLVGSVINWPTLPTLITMPILCWVYVRLANEEESDSIDRFGDQYLDYRTQTGKFLPRLNLPRSG